MKLYQTNSYLTHHSTTVQACRMIKNKTAVTLADTIFYPSGGGQPYDRGVVQINDIVLAVQRVVKADGLDWLCLEQPLDIKMGDSIMVTIDWDFRYQMMKAHTAEHLVVGIFENIVPRFQLKATHLGENGLIILTFDGDAYEPQQIIAMANQAINNNCQVIVEEIDDINQAYQQHQAIFRALPDVKYPSPLRIVTIEGIDSCPCGGTHLKSLAEIGQVSLVEHTASSLSFSIASIDKPLR